MMSISPIAEFMNIALHFMVWTLFLCGILIWTQRQENRKQRTILAVVLLLAAAMMFLRLVKTYEYGIPSSYQVLPISNLYGGYWALVLLFFYPVDVVNPGWLRWRTVFLIFLPIIAISLILAFIPFEFRELHSLQQMLAHIGEPNVWFRLSILFVFIIPYTILLLCVPYNWRQSSVDIKWILIYTIGVQGIGVLYIIFMLTGSLVVSALHLSYSALFFVYITYQELFLRLFPDTAKLAIEKPIIGIKPEIDSVALEGLWERFETHMNADEYWRSPDITIGDVAKAIGSNRSTLSAEISSREMGSFYDFVARYRINAFCELVKKGEIDNVNEALFSVGFRSRSTAYQRFKEQMGMTPAEYIKTIKNVGL